MHLQLELLQCFNESKAVNDGLREVTLSTQRLRVLPPAVLSNPGLESLDLDRNKLRSITGISKLCNLKRLILSKNEIVDFPTEIQSLVCLEKLELNQNQIRVIPEGVFSHLPRLKHLRLNNNRLGALPKDLTACQGSLQYLNISNNLFRTFPQPVLQLAHLQELHITAMLMERKSNLAHFIDNLEGSEEPEFYVDQWEKLKEMESCTLTVGLR
uniref:Leucine rich repeat containing 69 n=1 Tax=Aquila chrysaetos chrysaetos TaxID=223781 RepID=A0A663ETG7_AQUCH